MLLPMLMASAAAAQEVHLPLAGSSGTVQAPGRKLSFSSFSAESSNPTFPPPDEAAEQTVAATPVEQQSSQVVAGIVESFLHKEHLQPGELQCLMNGTGELAANVMSVSESSAMLLQQVLGGRNGLAPAGEQGEDAPIDDGAGDISAMVDALQAEQNGQPPPQQAQQQQQQQQQQQLQAQQQKQAQQAKAHHEASKSLAFFYGNRRLQMAAMAMNAPMLFMQLGVSVHEIVGLTKKIVKKCVKGDALEALQTAGEHMQSLQYVSGHLIANGADIVTELADAVMAYQKDDFQTFGHNLGKSLRKVLLSHSTNSSLPEGLPGKAVIANVTAGVLRGFFGEGFALDLHTKPGYDPIHIDLHNCIGRNLMFFQSVWGATMFFYGQKAAQGGDGQAKKKKPKQDSTHWGAALALTMMQFPTALRRCNIGSEEEHMLMDSIRALGRGFHYNLEVPSGTALTEDQMAKAMAQTVRDWAQMKWYTFGLDLGKLLQAMFETVYSQQYTVDSTGSLRKRLRASPSSAGPWTGGARGLFAATGLVPLTAVPLFAALLALTGRRSLSRWRHEQSMRFVQAESECVPVFEVDAVE